MGILNVTPDSFSEQGIYFDRKAAIARGMELEHEGADILDVGGESTRPGAKPVSAEEELDRTIPVIETLRRKRLKAPISVDTYKAVVAERAIRAGAEIVNDVSGFRYDAAMPSLVARERAAVVLMHIRGTPFTMQRLPKLRNVIESVRRGLKASIDRAARAGIARRRIIVDPGIGFGKTFDQNFDILRELARFNVLGCPILFGPSRKGFIRDTVLEEQVRGNQPDLPEEVLYGTAAVVAAAVLNGAHIVRVHDVRQMISAVHVADRILRNRLQA